LKELLTKLLEHLSDFLAKRSRIAENVKYAREQRAKVKEALH
jgi:hypothetical protein